jgi:hypothetical protein
LRCSTRPAELSFRQVALAQGSSYTGLGTRDTARSSALTAS